MKTDRYLNKQNITQALRFIAVGLLCAGIHYAVYMLLKQVLTNLSVSYSIGYLTSLIVNFFLTTYFTFRSSTSFGKFLGFLFSHAVNYLCNIAFFNLFIQIGISENTAPLFAIACSVPINFLILKFIFRKK